MAREAMSARIDGESEPVPAARVDEHLDGCSDCRVWLDRATSQAALLCELTRRPASLAPAAAPQRTSRTRCTLTWPQWALLLAGVAQTGVGVAQASGLGLGLLHNGMAASGHLLNESTAWSVTLGVVMIGGAIWRSIAAGLAAVLTIFVAVLAVYVLSDALSGAVTVERVSTHAPVLLGAVAAILVWRRTPRVGPAPHASRTEPDIVLPHNASRGRRRGHLWPTDGSAA